MEPRSSHGPWLCPCSCSTDDTEEEDDEEEEEERDSRQVAGDDS